MDIDHDSAPRLAFHRRVRSLPIHNRPLSAATWAKIGESSDFSNRFTESVTELRAQLIGSLAMVASYTIRHNSDVPIGTEKRDTRTAVSLQYDF